MGRRPLRSSFAPTNWPSEKISAAGPSHGSLCCERAASAPRTSRESKRIVFECGRNQREHGLFRGEAFEKFGFEAVVETGGVADVFFENVEPGADGEFFAESGFLWRGASGDWKRWC